MKINVKNIEKDYEYSKIPLHLLGKMVVLFYQVNRRKYL